MSTARLILRLKERGYSEVAEDQREYIERRMQLRLEQQYGGPGLPHLNRKKRARLDAALKLPTFMHMGGVTMARPGNNRWMAKEGIEDLSGLGFTNATSHLAQALTLPPLNTRDHAQ